MDDQLYQSKVGTWEINEDLNCNGLIMNNFLINCSMFSGDLKSITVKVYQCTYKDSIVLYNQENGFT